MLYFCRYNALSYCQNENVNGLLWILKSSQDRRALFEDDGFAAVATGINSVWIGVGSFNWMWTNGESGIIIYSVRACDFKFMSMS